ncbi:uncharacterized protein LOC124169799 [Ischnura elegans]|uniref:uncharacterized protein LOC124169799 n=1 Tax=Ischnura elegans TaxID=197161 RepID=UPI001ED8B234|nr:uncharacterized protein LOC124169799 [Ischnura elegans]XP_046404511.1 uncharacterized protein LOC124169799 [Ischnura elegans]XP_046404512.1 uncharacterized protein LOC124169799 [Ischnura elegans]
MATERSSPGTIYSPLPQSMSDVDSTCDEEEEEELNSVALGNEGGNHPLKTTHIHGAKSVADGKNGRGRANRGLYQPLGGSDLTLNGIPSHIGLKSKNDCLHESDMDPSQPPLILPSTPDKLVMSTSRKACFVFSILLCFLVVIGFLFVLPCDVPACVPPHERNTTSAPSDSTITSIPTSTIRSMGGSWERMLPGIELKGRAHLISSSQGPGLNMVFLVRGQLPGLSSASAVTTPSSMSLVSSSFLSESSKCSFAPAPGSSNGSSSGGFDQSTLATYCNTELEVTLNNTGSQQGWMTSLYVGDEVSSHVPEVNLSSSHYRSKRILDNPPKISPVDVTELVEPVVESKEKMKSAQVKVEGENRSEHIGKVYLESVDQDHEGITTEKSVKEKRSPKSVEKSKVDDNGSEFLSVLVGGDGGLVSLSGATGQPLWAVSLHSPPEELDCALLDTDNDGIPDCLAFSGRSGLLAAVNPTTGSVIWYLHDHKSQERPTALQFPVSIPDLDGDGTKDLAIACTLPVPPPQTTNQSSNRASSPNSSSYVLQGANAKGSSKTSTSFKKDSSFSPSSYVTESTSYQPSRPLPSPSSSPDTVSLAVASGRSGKIIGHPFTPSSCVTVSSITLNMKTLDLFYRCVTDEGDEISKSLSVEDLYGEKKQNVSSSSAPPVVTSTPTPDQESSSMFEPGSILSMPLSASSVENASPAFSSSPASHSERHSTSSSAWVSDHRLLVENHGHCHTILLSPFSVNASFQTPPCSVSVRLTDSRNSTLWAHEGVLAHAMDPVPLLFRQPNRGLWSEDSTSTSQSSSEHPVSGFVLKFWQWSMPKGESPPLSREDKTRDPPADKSPGGPNSLFRTRLRRNVSSDLVLPPLAAVSSSSSSSNTQNHSSQVKRQSPIGNVPRHGGLFPSGSGKKKQKGTSYKGSLPPIVNQLKERVVLITFNDTGLHVINASQSDVTQLCERVRPSSGSGKKRGKGGRVKEKVLLQESLPPDQKLRCQPELAFQEQSLLVADLDKDGYQELVSYLTTYVDIRKDDSDSRRRGNSPKWFLESRVKVVLLEAELPKLYEAVATPGS